VIQLSSDLQRNGVRVMLAAELGAVREVLGEVSKDEHGVWNVFAWVEAAVEAASKPPVTDLPS
jgi:hypothetical protein